MQINFAKQDKSKQKNEPRKLRCEAQVDFYT